MTDDKQDEQAKFLLAKALIKSAEDTFYEVLLSIEEDNDVPRAVMLDILDKFGYDCGIYQDQAEIYFEET